MTFVIGDRSLKNCLLTFTFPDSNIKMG